ncbi:MAG: IS30 family transposase [Polaribacter sp.]
MKYFFKKIFFQKRGNFSPEQIVKFTKLSQKQCVSPERIYQHIWENKKQGGDLYLHLRTQGKRYRKRGASKDKRGQIVGRIDMDQRPKIVEEKTRFGDLEIDLVIGKNHKKAILAANDRATTGKTKITLLNSKSCQEVKEKQYKF